MEGLRLPGSVSVRTFAVPSVTGSQTAKHTTPNPLQWDLTFNPKCAPQLCYLFSRLASSLNQIFPQKIRFLPLSTENSWQTQAV